MSALDVQAVRQTLHQFQDGYTRRNPENIAEFLRLFVPEDSLEVIGTGALDPGEDEWCLGVESTRELILNDWEGWGDLALDVAGARIFVLGDVAWLATTATVSMTIDSAETCRDTLAYIRERGAEEDGLSPRAELLEILRAAANTLNEAEQGSQYVWPLRFTAVLVRREGRFLFHQMQFSFATTRFPDVRRVK